MHAYSGWKLKQAAVTTLLIFTTVTASMGGTSNGVADSGPAAASAGNASGASSAASNAPTASSKAEAAANPASPITESQFEELRGLLESQGEQLKAAQEKILELEAALRPGSAEAAAVPIAAPIAAISSPAIAPAPQAGQDFGKRLDSLEARLKNFGPFSLAGDVRVRNEPYFGGPVNNSQVRDRERYRARLQFNAKLNDDFGGGIGLSTGDLNDPISSNQTANQFFTRKPFALDRAFINYTPHQFSPLTLTGGKFVFPAYKTQLTWDEDIFPEGVAEKLEWKSDNWHVLRQFALIGFQLPFAETQSTEAVKTFTQPINATFPYPDSSIRQSVVYGGQVQTRWQLASWLSFTADSAFYNYHNADPIALANQVAYGNSTASSPGSGTLTLNNTLTNSFQTITETVSAAPVTGTTPVVVSKTIIAAKLNSKFALTDNIAQFDIKTPSDKWPIRILGDYVQNTEACANDAPLHTTATPVAGGVIGAPVTNNGVCHANERRANWLEARFGRAAQKGDWQFAYTHMLIEHEAVISLFDFSEIRQGSNVAQNRVEAIYQVNPNVSLGFTGYFGRIMGTTDATETLLKRLQFDVLYRF
jgi:Putative porin